MNAAAALLLVVAAAPSPAAVVPIAGEGVTTADAPTLAKLERAVRAALERGGAKLQPAAATRAHVAGAVELGLVCTSDDVPCLSKLGLLAEAPLLYVPVAKKTADGYVVTVVAVDPKATAVVARATRGPVDPAQPAAALDALVVELRARASAPSPPTAHAPAKSPASASAPRSPAADAPASSASPTGTASSSSSSSSSSSAAAAPDAALLWTGAATAGVGALVAVGAGVGAWAIDDDLRTPRPFDDEQQGRLVFGQTLIGLAAVGVVVAGIGAAVAGVGLASDGP